MASLNVLFYKCIRNLYTMVHFTSLQLPIPSEREHYISVMSDIVLFHSKRLERLAIHFLCESCQLYVNGMEYLLVSIVSFV